MQRKAMSLLLAAAGLFICVALAVGVAASCVGVWMGGMAIGPAVILITLALSAVGIWRIFGRRVPMFCSFGFAYGSMGN